MLLLMGCNSPLAVAESAAKKQAEEKAKKDQEDAEYKRIMNTWLGATQGQLIQQWGPPSKTTSDGQGGKILIYSEPQYMPSFDFVDIYVYYTNKYMYINDIGKVYHWMTKNSLVQIKD